MSRTQKCVKEKRKRKNKVPRTQNRAKENQTCETERYLISASTVAYGYSTAVYICQGTDQNPIAQLKLIPGEIKIGISRDKSHF